MRVLCVCRSQQRVLSARVCYIFRAIGAYYYSCRLYNNGKRVINSSVINHQMKVDSKSAASYNDVYRYTQEQNLTPINEIVFRL